MSWLLKWWCNCIFSEWIWISHNFFFYLTNSNLLTPEKRSWNHTRIKIYSSLKVAKRTRKEEKWEWHIGGLRGDGKCVAQGHLHFLFVPPLFIHFPWRVKRPCLSGAASTSFTVDYFNQYLTNSLKKNRQGTQASIQIHRYIHCHYVTSCKNVPNIY